MASMLSVGESDMRRCGENDSAIDYVFLTEQSELTVNFRSDSWAHFKGFEASFELISTSQVTDANRGFHVLSTEKTLDTDAEKERHLKKLSCNSLQNHLSSELTSKSSLCENFKIEFTVGQIIFGLKRQQNHEMYKKKVFQYCFLHIRVNKTQHDPQVQINNLPI